MLHHLQTMKMIFFNFYNLHFQGFKLGEKINKFGKKSFKKKLNSTEFMEFFPGLCLPGLSKPSLMTKTGDQTFRMVILSQVLLNSFPSHSLSFSVFAGSFVSEY